MKQKFLFRLYELKGFHFLVCLCMCMGAYAYAPQFKEGSEVKKDLLPEIITPSDNSWVENLTNVVIEFSDRVIATYSTKAVLYKVTDEGDEFVEELGDPEDNSFLFFFDASKYIFSFSHPITAAGKYKLVIPEEFFEDKEHYASTILELGRISPEIVLTYNVHPYELEYAEFSPESGSIVPGIDEVYTRVKSDDVLGEYEISSELKHEVALKDKKGYRVAKGELSETKEGGWDYKVSFHTLEDETIPYIEERLGDYTVELPEGIIVEKESGRPAIHATVLSYQVGEEIKSVATPEFLPDMENNTMEIIAPEGTVYYRTYAGNRHPGEYSEYSEYVGSFEVTGNLHIDAFAYVEGRGDSEIVSYYVDWVKAKQPLISYFDNRMAFSYLDFDFLEGVEIYYSIDEPISDSNKILYDGYKFSITDADRIYAYTSITGYVDSDVIEYKCHDHQLSIPKAIYLPGNSYGSIEITHSDDELQQQDDEEARESYLFYTLYDSEENIINRNNQYDLDIELIPGKIIVDDVPYNSTLRCYAAYYNWDNSDEFVLTHTEKPIINVDNYVASITMPEGVEVSDVEIRYTLDGTMPAIDSELYAEPILLKESATIRAVAFCNGLIPAEGDPVVVNYNRCAAPVFRGYDGRYLELDVADADRIYYSLDATDPTESQLVIDGSSSLFIDVEGLGVFRAVVGGEGKDFSEEYAYDVRYYCNDSDLYVTASGQVSMAFEWCGGNPEMESLRVHGSLYKDEEKDKSDYLALMSGEVRHIDLSGVADEMLPSQALDSENLVTVILPETMTKVGDNVFGTDNKTLCAVEFHGERKLPENLLEGVDNPNLLIFVNRLIYADTFKERFVNIVSGNHANSMRLTDGKPFYSPMEITADEIIYKRTFSKEILIDGCGGWEGIVLPFDVQSVSHAESGVLTPFGAESPTSGKHYWLCLAGDGGWQTADMIRANVPYIIAMPNHALYADEYNVNGEITFSSKNAVVAGGDAVEGGSFHNNPFVGTYDWVKAHNSVLVINDDYYEYAGVNHAPGSVFVGGERGARPFEAYVRADAGVKALPIFSNSAVGQLPDANGMKVWSEGPDICILSEIGQNVNVYDMVGKLVGVAEVRAGEVCRVCDLAAGIYIVGHAKVIVK